MAWLRVLTARVAALLKWRLLEATFGSPAATSGGLQLWMDSSRISGSAAVPYA